MSCSNWFRSNGATGWLNATYGGGIYQDDSTYVKVYGNKAFKVTSTASDSINTDGGIKASGSITAPNFICSTDSLMKSVRGNLTFRTYNGSIAVGSGNTGRTMYINNFEDPLIGTVPTSWYWQAGSSLAWANFYTGSLTANGTISASSSITTTSYVNSAEGYYKTGFTNDFVLLAGGGTCTRSDVLPKKQESLLVVNSSYVSSCSVMVYQLGHIVIIQGTFKTGGSASNDTPYFTIPSTIGVPSDDTGWSGAAGNQNTGIKMYIPKGSRTIYLIWNDTGTNTTYQMSWVYYTSTY